MRDPRRQPAGIPAGGQFAVQSHLEPEIGLGEAGRGSLRTADGHRHPVRVTARKGKHPVDIKLAEIAEAGAIPGTKEVTSVIGDVKRSVQMLIEHPNLATLGVLVVQMPLTGVKAVREARWHPLLAKYNKELPGLRFLDTELPTIRDFRERRALDVFKRNWAGKMERVELVKPNAPLELNETIARQWDIADERQRHLTVNDPDLAAEWQQVKDELVRLAESTDVVADSRKKVVDGRTRKFSPGEKRYSSYKFPFIIKIAKEDSRHETIHKEAAGMFDRVARQAQRLNPEPVNVPEPQM